MLMVYGGGMNRSLQKSFYISRMRYFMLLASFCFTMQSSYGFSWFSNNGVSDAEIKKQVAEELSLQLAEKENLTNEIADFEKDVRRKLAKKEKLPYTGKHYQKYYPLPYWPYYSTFFYHKHFIQVDATFETASQAYASDGSSRDLSKIVFGDKTITVQDVLLASKLVALDKVLLPCASAQTAIDCPNLVGTVTPQTCLDPVPNAVAVNNKGYFLGALANQELEFDANEQIYQVALNYACNFNKGDIALGLHLPLVIKSHKLSLETKDIDCAIKQNLDCIEGANPDNLALNFSKKYGTLENFVNAILAGKCINFNHKDTHVGLGDLSAFINFNIHSVAFTRLMAGLVLLVPTGKKRNPSDLWPVEFGNGGFVELGFFGSALWGSGGVINPYIHTKATISFAANVSRRVPCMVNYSGNQPDGTSPADAGIKLVLGDGVALKSGPAGAFCLPDSTVRGFADSVQRIHLRKGPELFIRVGNIFYGAPTDHGYIDIYYDLLVKGRDHLSSGQSFSSITSDVLLANTDRISHTFGASYNYQFDAYWRLRCGTSYVVAGRNTPQAFGLNLAFNVDF